MAARKPLVLDGSGNIEQLQTSDTLNVDAAAVFNESGVDVDFRVEGDTDPNLFIVDASEDAVKVGSSSTVNGVALFSPSVGTVLNIEKVNRYFQVFGTPTNALISANQSGTNGVSLGVAASGAPMMSISQAEVVVNEANDADIDFRVEGDTLSHALFLDASAATENLALVAAAAPNWQSMDRGLFLGDASTVPTGNPSSGVFVYSEAGVPKIRMPDGTIIDLSAAGGSGAFGGAVTLEYTFSTTTTDSDPGNGLLRLNNATQNASGQMFIDLLDVNGVTVTDAIDSMNNGGALGLRFGLRMVHKTDPTKFLLWDCVEVTSASGYRKIVFNSLLAASSASPFSNSDPVLVSMVQIGATGATGATGSTGSDANVPDIQIFAVPGTYTGGWTKPPGAVTVERHLIGAGGTGGDGRQGLSGTARGGGGGGGGGGYSFDSNPASEFGATETVIVGAPASVTAGVVTDNTNGNAGGAGGSSSMTATGSGGATLTAGGGAGGGGGTTTGGAGGTGGTGTTENGGAGGPGGVGSDAFNALDGASTSGLMAGGGGGGGAGLTSANAPNVTSGLGGGSGGATTLRALSLAAAAVAGAQPLIPASQGNDGPAIAAGTSLALFGGGGGGGGPTAVSFATAFVGAAFGGFGGKFGGGGGGGAAYVNGVDVSNNGFPGGQGIAIIITRFA